MAIDAQGMLKVTHVMNMGSPMAATTASDMLETQVRRRTRACAGCPERLCGPA